MHAFVPAQRRKFALHMMSQVPFAHTGTPFIGVGQEVQPVPQ
jgi:hypothetical protein